MRADYADNSGTTHPQKYKNHVKWLTGFLFHHIFTDFGLLLNKTGKNILIHLIYSLKHQSTIAVG